MPAPTPPPDADVDDDAHAHHSPPRDATDADPATARDDVELVGLLDDTTDPHRYTVCPADSDAADLVTTWITTDADAVHDLTDWR